MSIPPTYTADLQNVQTAAPDSAEAVIWTIIAFVCVIALGLYVVEQLLEAENK